MRNRNGLIRAVTRPTLVDRIGPLMRASRAVGEVRRVPLARLHSSSPTEFGFARPMKAGTPHPSHRTQVPFV